MAPLPKPRPDPSPPPARRPVAIRLGAAVWPEVMASGWGSLGLSAEIGARYRWISASVEAHGDPPLGPQRIASVGDVAFARLSGALLVCAHFGWFAGCGVADVGRFFFPNHIQALPASAFYGAAGVRAGLEFPVVSTRVFLRVAMDLRAPISPARFVSKRANVFAAAGPGAGLGLGVVVELPP